MKQRYGEKAKLCYIDTDSFKVYIKTGDIYKDNVKEIGKRFDASIYKLDRPSPKRRKKVIGFTKDELVGKIRKEFPELVVKTFSYLTDNNDEYKKAKATKIYSIKQRIKFKDYLNQLEKTKILLILNSYRKKKTDIKIIAKN